MPTYPALYVNPPNIRSVMGQIAQEKSQAFRNRLSQQDMGLRQERFGIEKQQYSDAQAREKQLVEGRAAYLGGDESALSSLAAVDPEGAAKLQDIVSQASEEGREALAEQNLEFAQMAHYIAGAPNEVMKQSRWQEVRSSSPEIADVMPGGYDQGWLDLQVARIMAKDEILRAPPSGFQAGAGGGVEPIPGGPADPAYLGRKAAAQQTPPSGYRRTPEGDLSAIPGGPGEEKPLAIERKMKMAGIDPNSEEGRELIMADLAGQQIELEQTDGGLRLRIGKGAGAGNEGLTKSNRTFINKEIMKADAALERLDNIRATWNPEWNTLEKRANLKWAAFKEKTFGEELSPEVKKELTAYSGASSNAISNINLVIHDLTGAQMSVYEAKRLRLPEPDPGEGIWPADSPTEFKAKLDARYKAIEKVRARYKHYTQNGVYDVNEMAGKTPLDGMEVFVNPETHERIVQIDDEWVPL